jgi:ribosome-binding protein aMBF1 (putative translation factor)
LTKVVFTETVRSSEGDRARRERLGLAIADLAERAGIAKEVLQRYESAGAAADLGVAHKVGMALDALEAETGTK